jgi:hypothetical protein
MESLGLSQLNTLRGKNKDSVVELRTLHISTTELRAEDTDQTVAEQGEQEQEGLQEIEGYQRRPRTPFRQRWQEGRRIDRG